MAMPAAAADVAAAAEELRKGGAVLNEDGEPYCEIEEPVDEDAHAAMLARGCVATAQPRDAPEHAAGDDDALFAKLAALEAAEAEALALNDAPAPTEAAANQARADANASFKGLRRGFFGGGGGGGRRKAAAATSPLASESQPPQPPSSPPLVDTRETAAPQAFTGVVKERDDSSDDD